MQRMKIQQKLNIFTLAASFCAIQRFEQQCVTGNVCCHLAAGISCKMLIDRGMWGGVSGLCLEVFPEDSGVVLFKAFGAVEAAGCCAGRV